MAITQYPWKVYATGTSYNDLASNDTAGGAATTNLHKEDIAGDTMFGLDETNGGALAFRFVSFASATAINASVASGDQMMYTDVYGGVVTDDYDGGYTTDPNDVAGPAAAALTKGNNGWMQILGYHSGVNLTGITPAAGDVLIPGAADKVFGKVTAGTAPTRRALGTILAVVASNHAPVRLWGIW